MDFEAKIKDLEDERSDGLGCFIAGIVISSPFLVLLAFSIFTNQVSVDYQTQMGETGRWPAFTVAMFMLVLTGSIALYGLVWWRSCKWELNELRHKHDRGYT